MHVFIMRDNWHGGLAAIQSLGRRGHRLTVGMEYEGSVNAQSDFVSDRVAALRGEDPQARAQALVEFVEARGIDLVVPIADEDVETVAHAAVLRPRCRAFVGPSVAALAEARDRNAFSELCQRIGLPTPRAMRVTAETVHAAAEEIGFPCYLKFSETHGGAGVKRLEQVGDVEAQLDALRAAGEAQLQEAVIGMSLGVTGFAIDGKMLNAFGLQTDYEFSKSGTPPYVWRHDDPRLIDGVTRLAAALNWTGAINVGFLEDGEGRYLATEINPRLGGSTNCALTCGCDLPSYYLAAVGEDAGPPIFEPNDNELFIVLVKESQWFKRPGGARLAKQMRASYRYIENDFPDDRGYHAALMRRLRSQRKHAWLRRAIGRVLRLFRA